MPALKLAVEFVILGSNHKLLLANQLVQFGKVKVNVNKDYELLQPVLKT